MIQTSRSPDLVVHHLGAQVSTLSNKQAVLDFLLRAVVVRESPTARKEGRAGGEGAAHPIPPAVPQAAAQPVPRLPGQGQANAVVSKPAKRREMLQKRFGFALFYHVKLK